MHRSCGLFRRFVGRDNCRPEVFQALTFCLGGCGLVFQLPLHRRCLVILLPLVLGLLALNLITDAASAPSRVLDALLFRVVTPWDYSLTYEDALWALQQVMDVEDNPLDKAQWALQWASRGPSYYKARR